MAGISIKTTATVITPSIFKKRCDSLLKQKFVRFTQEEKKEIRAISKNPDVSDGFDRLTNFLNKKYDNIQNKSYDLFASGKTLAEGKFIPGFFARLNTERKAFSIKPEKATGISEKITNYKEKVLKFFSDLIYIPTSNPDILKIEQNLKQIGIKAKFSDKSSPDFAKLTEETLKDLRKQGYELPERVCVSPLIGMCSKACVVMGPNKPATTIFFNTSFSEKTAKNNENYITGKFLDGAFSTENPKHIIRHEIGHFLHSKKGLINLYLQFFSNLAHIPKSEPVLTENNKNLLKKSVSEYATSDNMLGTEAVAEIFAGLTDGKKYSREIMDLYIKLNGPIPKQAELAL